MSTTFLLDDHGRRIRKLRVSLTDRCNLRCHYCMPLDMEFMSEARYLGAAEYAEIVRALCARGLEEVRLTGGEPLVRAAFPEIAAALAELPLKKIGLTTNGVLLDRHWALLERLGIRSLNISLDSLNPARFRAITHGDHFARVLRHILTAHEKGFHVKINTVIMRGQNDDELENFVRWSARHGIEVRFLELMRIGFANRNQREQFLPAADMIERLKVTEELHPVDMPADATSFNFRTASGAHIGFIASESKAFCGACSRWRLSADGILRACLLKEDGVSVRYAGGVAREEIFNQVLKMKPALRPAEVAHAMNQLGG